MTPPANLSIGCLVLAPANLAEHRIWCIYERLDIGAVEHVRYVGLLPASPGESAEELFARALERAAREGG